MIKHFIAIADQRLTAGPKLPDSFAAFQYLCWLEMYF